jgi:hypothetical protein
MLILLFAQSEYYGQKSEGGIIINKTTGDRDVVFYVNAPAVQGQDNEVYIMGSFNNWDPGKYEPPDSTDLPLEHLHGEEWKITIQLPARKRFEYKYTRGSYQTREVAYDSSDIPNRRIFINNEEANVTFDTVQTWADLVLPPVPETGVPVLSYNNNSPQTSISVTWSTELFGESKIYYGIEDIGENMIIVNEHRDMLEKGDSLIHRVTLVDLQPSAEYKYKVVTEGVFESKTLSFTTASYTDKFSFVVIGDNRPSADLGVLNGILGDSPELILHTGDVVSKGLILKTWFEFFRNWEEVLGTIPWLVVYGNHEQDVYLNKFFNFPENGSSDSSNFGHWYSMDYNNVHITAVDNYRGYYVGSEQYNWLINDLENIPGHIDHKIIMFHEPPFSSGKHGPNHNVRDILVPVIEKYDIDLVFCGHEHLYERSVVNGIPYFTTGGAGSPIYYIHGGTNDSSVYAESNFHYLRLNVDGKNFSVEVISTDSTQIDYYESLEEPPPPVPENYSLSQNFPNPFNPTTTIRYSLPDESYVTLQVFDALGALVATLVDEQKSPGTYDAEFNVNTATKNLISSGVYLYRIKAGEHSESKKLIVLK